MHELLNPSLGVQCFKAIDLMIYSLIHVFSEKPVFDFCILLSIAGDTPINLHFLQWIHLHIMLVVSRSQTSVKGCLLTSSSLIKLNLKNILKIILNHWQQSFIFFL